MRNIFYSDTDFVKENSNQYILSIRFTTDGLSFCIHESSGKLLVFSLKPHTLTSQDEIIAKTKQAIAEDELLKLKYKKVYINPCQKEKILIPAHIFNKNHLPDLFRLCVPTDKNDHLLYRKIRILEAYIAESLPRNFVTFLTTKYQSLCVVNSAYPFIINSLSSTLLNTHHLFIDIHETYFDMLITKDAEMILFNSFQYNAIPDLIYYVLQCIKKTGIKADKLRTVISGNLVNDPKLYQLLSNYIPEISFLEDSNLEQLVKNEELNSSCFVHLLSMHQCE
ncbi:DUF3822 family protein [Odoribacter sp. OttesenSCG-928-J03]|nr:DUF3822 family protein [Odoribacter sp. OttesenSCG-928-J03]MDL2330698.1 DUF3822 family protein [Odoribacter sp. OttesenSCG-928-A06]